MKDTRGWLSYLLSWLRGFAGSLYQSAESGGGKDNCAACNLVEHEWRQLKN